MDFKSLFSPPSEARGAKHELMKAADSLKRGAMRYRVNRSIRAGWATADPGDMLELDEHQAAALRHHHGKDVLEDVSPTAEEPQDEAPAAEPESSASNSEPAGAPPADEDDEDEDPEERDLEAGDAPLNRMVSQSGRGGGGKRGGGKKK